MGQQAIFEDTDVAPSRWRSYTVVITSTGLIILCGGCRLKGIVTSDDPVPYHVVSPNYPPGEAYLGAVKIPGGFRLLSALPNPTNTVSQIARHEFFFGNVQVGGAELPSTGQLPATVWPLMELSQIGL